MNKYIILISLFITAYVHAYTISSATMNSKNKMVLALKMNKLPTPLLIEVDPLDQNKVHYLKVPKDMRGQEIKHLISFEDHLLLITQFNEMNAKKAELWIFEKTKWEKKYTFECNDILFSKIEAGKISYECYEYNKEGIEVIKKYSPTLLSDKKLKANLLTTPSEYSVKGKNLMLKGTKYDWEGYEYGGQTVWLKDILK